MKVWIREGDKKPWHGVFMCTIVQRIAWSPQLCHSLLSNAKQEINVACCVFACVCLCVWKWERVRVRECLQPPLAASVHSWKSVCVWERQRCVCSRAKCKPMPGKAGQCHPISKSMSLLSLAVNPISGAGYALTKSQLAWKLSAPTWINSATGPGFTLFSEKTS